MPNYMVNYDLRKPGRNYDDLYAEIRNSSRYAHVAESAWIVGSSESAEQLLERLAHWLDGSDTLLVTQMSSSWAGIDLDPRIVAWMRSNVAA